MKFKPWENRKKKLQSRPARGAWVEIEQKAVAVEVKVVAPRKGRVG